MKQKQENKKLRKIKGEKIRWQYFNMLICLFLLIELMLFCIIITTAINKGEFTSLLWLEDYVSVSLILLIIISPFCILSLLNRFFFGSTVCVLTDKGIHTKDTFIYYEDIELIEYDINLPGKYSWQFCGMYVTGKTIGGKKIKIFVKHVPFYIMKRIKKQSPKTEMRLSGWSKFILISLPVGIVILSVLSTIFS